MCGRYTLKTPGPELAAQFELEGPVELRPRFNVAPTQDVAAVVREKGAGRRLSLLRWGLIPFWAKDAKIGNRLINARADSVLEKPAFRDAVRRRRCLVLADGFYEWHDAPEGRRPLHFRREDGRPFAFAGLFDEWKAPTGELIRSCTILTTEPNALLAPYHDRMPVILPAPAQARWLSEEPLPPEELRSLLVPHPAEGFAAFPVSRLVNSPKTDSPECLLTEEELLSARAAQLPLLSSR